MSATPFALLLGGFMLGALFTGFVGLARELIAWIRERRERRAQLVWCRVCEKRLATHRDEFDFGSALCDTCCSYRRTGHHCPGARPIVQRGGR